ncbi:hypothetical protein FHX57_002702 [Paraburkholderia tropica]|uniref:hypothetical protein n=1 Tax=Paraburkholderia tropica TaxID=92647 RepID=UPI00160749F1|nr:hypothetical protein [Paraburkholderia tropica]MBB3000350.1 hypothetical protein [Paraburkholderia tropica]MBB6319980.1 hypothetical protein [Paraburkholderia tropica]
MTSTLRRHATHVATALLLSSGFSAHALAATPTAPPAPPTAFHFALPGGGAIVYGKALNPKAPLPERAWREAVFELPGGATFSLLPRPGERNAAGTQMESPSVDDISPSGRYVVVARVSSGTVSAGPGQPEIVSSREYCSAIEVSTGCISADQTGEICGAGWQQGQAAQWGTDDQTRQMLDDERPSARRLLRLVASGQPIRPVLDDDAGVDNLLRCDPPSPDNRAAYRTIAGELRAAGGRDGARLIDVALAGVGSKSASPETASSAPREATVTAQKATLYTAPDDAHASHAWLIRDDAVSVLKSAPAGWMYVDYVGASGRHLLRWIKADQISIRP